MNTKKCSRCQEYKTLSNFSSNRCKKDGLNQECKDCCKVSQKIQRERGNTRWQDLKKNFGITKDEYLSMLDKQSGMCLLCGVPHKEEHKKRLHVDHCHTTGKIRGLLCNNCNIGLGHFKDNIQVLQNAIKYLEEEDSLCAYYKQQSKRWKRGIQLPLAGKILMYYLKNYAKPSHRQSSQPH